MKNRATLPNRVWCVSAFTPRRDKKLGLSFSINVVVGQLCVSNVKIVMIEGETLRFATVL
jgi:hypothetical protein